MAGQLSRLKKLDAIDGVHIAESGNLRCCAIVLNDGSLCVFSPVSGLREELIHSLGRLGEVRFLLTPNHYHNKGIAEYCQTFPDAVFCASSDAIARLYKVTGLVAETIDVLEPFLCTNMTMLEPEGLKTGEIWLRIQTNETIAWLVVDGFSGPKINEGQIWSDQPEILKTFPSYGVGDKTVYSDWLTARIETDQPETIIPCHGSLLSAKTLPDKLKKLVASHF